MKRGFFYGTTCALACLSGQLVTAQEEQDGVFLGTIVLGESKREVATDTATPVTEVDQTEIDDRQAGTVAELIDSVPGVSLVNGSTPNGSGINIRGFGANSTFGSDQKVAIQIDGASVGSEEIYRIGTQLFTDPELFKSVSVIRGTVGSFEYGTGIVGGVVLLETKDASDFTGGEPGVRVRQTLQFTTNGDGLTSSSIVAWQPTENLEFLANYTWREQDFQTDGDGEDIGNSAFDLPSSLIKSRYRFGQDRAHALSLTYTETSESDRDVPYDTFLTSDDVFGNVDRDIETETAVLSYEYNPPGDDLIDVTVDLSYANQEIEQEYVEGSSSCEGGPPFPCDFPFPEGGFSVVNADQQYETTKLSIRNTSLFTTGSVDHELRAGVELLRKERLDAASAPGGEDNRVAFFAIDEMRIGEAWTITPALRYETSEIDGTLDDGRDVSYDNDALVGGLSVRYAFSNGVALFGSAAYTENLPILDDLENDELMEQAEEARTFELGASLDRTSIFADEDVLAIKGTFYRTELTEVTSYVSDVFVGPGPDDIESQPLDRVETEGFELEASYAMRSGFYVDLNANIVAGEETDANGRTTDWRITPADSARLTLGQRFGEELDLSWEIVAARAENREDDRSPGFAVHNLRATYVPQQGVLEGSELRLGLENAFDREFTPHLSTRPAPGRNIKLSLARTF
ncbi:TonB-dependent receptor domain-containing protein [Aestuariibius insulae]|uniref:TonB-dependent receptor domain-containing protein n=1 Tax=Aestuariibius insulae TaxID=2058287 RepID=UPI00345E9E7B